MNKVIIYFLFISAVAYTQQQRKEIKGIVFFNTKSIADVHIVNKNSLQGTVTNTNGLFEINIAIGDTIEFTHINLEQEKIIITADIMAQNKFEIHLKENIVILDEITLNKHQNFLHILPSKRPAPIVNAKTLNLPFAKTKVKKEYKIVNFQSGGTFSINNIINSLNGVNKRKRELQKIIIEDHYLQKIRHHFTDDFFTKDLKIKKEKINTFLIYCNSKSIIPVFKSKNYIELTSILIESSKTYRTENNSKNMVND